jgi:PAS domain S-box-containing protein
LNALTLAETQQSLALALASIEAGLLATDRNARVTQLNQEAARVLGWTEAEAIGRSYWEVFAREGRPPVICRPMRLT